MTDLYDLLDITRTATADVVKKAYRKKATKIHPDHGGSDEDFSAVNHAYLVLSDPLKRWQYDETGTVDERPVEIKAKEILRGMLMDAIERAGESVFVINIIAVMKESVLKHRRGIEQTDLPRAEKRLKKFRKLKSALAHRGGHPDFLMEQLEYEERNLEAAILEGKALLDVDTVAIKLLDEYSFKVENMEGINGRFEKPDTRIIFDKPFTF